MIFHDIFSGQVSDFEKGPKREFKQLNICSVITIWFKNLKFAMVVYWSKFVL